MLNDGLKINFIFRWFDLNPCCVLVQPRKTRPDKTERLLTGMLRIKTKSCFNQGRCNSK